MICYLIPCGLNHYLLIFYKNGETRFPYIAQCAKKHSKPEQSHPDYEAVWSTNKSGQSKFGGWKPEAIDHFLHYRKSLAVVRRKPSTHLVELDALNNIQAKRRIRNGNLAADPMDEAEEEEEVDQNLGGFMDDSDDEAVEVEGFDPYSMPVAKKAKRSG